MGVVLLHQVTNWRHNLVSRSCPDTLCCSTGNVDLTLRGIARPLTNLCVGSLSSQYLSCLAWSRRGLPTRLCVGLLFSRHPSRPAWSRRRLLTCLCVGSLFLWGLLVPLPVTGREVGLWREIIFDFDPSCFNTTGFLRSSSLYRPRGVSIFPDH